MDGYTHKNLREVEDSAPKFGHSPALEARFAADELGTGETGVSFQRLAPGERMPFGHHHGEQEEVYVVVEGAGRARLDDEVVDVRRWDALRVSPEVTRAFEAGDDGLTWLAIGAPRNMADAEVVPEFWSDAND
jgi:uncharacterized cupin superfamily protein